MTTSLMDAHAEQITLGTETYDLTPQRVGYLRANLGAFINEIGSSTAGGSGGLAGGILGRAYDLLSVFIPPDENGRPKLMPRWQFEGFASEEAMQAGAYQRSGDKGPSGPQINHALSTAFRVNGLDVWNVVRQLVDPPVLRRLFTDALLDTMDSASSLPSSPAVLDGDSSTPSTPPTSTGPEDPSD